MAVVLGSIDDTKNAQKNILGDGNIGTGRGSWDDANNDDRRYVGGSSVTAALMSARGRSDDRNTTQKKRNQRQLSKQISQ